MMPEFLSINGFTSALLLLMVIMFFFCIILSIKYVRLLKELELYKSERLPQAKKEPTKKEDIVSINKISQEIEEKIEHKNENKQQKTTVKSNTKQKKETPKQKIEIYQNEYKSPKTNSNTKKTKNTINKSNEFIVDEFVKKEKKNNSKKTTINKEQEFLQEISNQIQEEIKPQTIELTDYEKDEEENAIISYQELLNTKEKKTNNIDEETVNFIEELKKLRNSLN